jgi:flagellar motility protein MotE (MotC chaperone)
LLAAPAAAEPAAAEPEPANTDDPAEGGSPARAKAKKKKPQIAAFAGRGVPQVLPSLTSTALKNELRQSLVQPGEVGAPVSDKVRLEQLVTEIAQAREALKQETARLEALIKQRGSCEGEARGLPAEGSPAVAAAALAAKDMAREQLDSVSKAMKGMKPEQAAAVLSRLDHRLAAEVLRRMRPADAGLVMGFLKPELAAELATEIATRKPTFGNKGAAP